MAAPTGLWAYDTSMNPAELPPPPSDGLEVSLDTGPYGKCRHSSRSGHEIIAENGSVANRTHWQQCRLLLSEPLAVNRGQRIVGTIRFRTNSNRSYDLDLNIHVVSGDAKDGEAMIIPNTERTGRFDLGKQTYNYSYNPDAAMAGMLNV
jgi:histone-arginine methyltransferase CARM1